MLSRIPRGRDERWMSVTTPTGFTRWTRVFLPWQFIRFVMINLKMVEIIIKSHN